MPMDNNAGAYQPTVYTSPPGVAATATGPAPIVIPPGGATFNIPATVPAAPAAFPSYTNVVVGKVPAPAAEVSYDITYGAYNDSPPRKATVTADQVEFTDEYVILRRGHHALGQVVFAVNADLFISVALTPTTPDAA
jgi:hypothetical protein